MSLKVQVSRYNDNYTIFSSISVKMAPLSYLSFATVIVNMEIEFLACSTQKQRETDFTPWEKPWPFLVE